jgi:hypothetical protein
MPSPASQPKPCDEWKNWIWGFERLGGRRGAEVDVGAILVHQDAGAADQGGPLHRARQVVAEPVVVDDAARAGRLEHGARVLRTRM